MAEVERLEAELRAAKAAVPAALSAAERAALQAMGSDLPRVWRHPAATMDCKKRIPWLGSGNPGGRGREYHECLALYRQHSPEAAEKMYALMSCGDERVEYMAADWIFTRAWGKQKDLDPKELQQPRMRIDLSRLSREEIALLLKITTSGAIRPTDDSGDTTAREPALPGAGQRD
jgi:hypothetical protein